MQLPEFRSTFIDVIHRRMTAYYVITYSIENQKEYEKYNRGSNHITAQTVAKHGGEIVVVDREI